MIYQRSGWCGHYSPIASSDFHDFDWYVLNLEDGTESPFTNDKKYGASKIRRFPELNVVKLDDNTYISGEGARSSRSEYYRTLWEKLPDLQNVRRIHVLPDLNSDRVHYVVVQNEKDIIGSTFYILDQNSNQLEKVTSLPFEAVWPKYSPPSRNYYFADQVAATLYTLDTLGNLDDVEFIDDQK